MCSLKYLLDETESTSTNKLQPLFEVQLKLNEFQSNYDLFFDPSMNLISPKGFFQIINELISNIYVQGSLIKRVASHLNRENYQVTSHATFILEIQ